MDDDDDDEEEEEDEDADDDDDDGDGGDDDEDEDEDEDENDDDDDDDDDGDGDGDDHDHDHDADGDGGDDDDDEDEDEDEDDDDDDNDDDDDGDGGDDDDDDGGGGGGVGGGGDVAHMMRGCAHFWCVCVCQRYLAADFPGIFHQGNALGCSRIWFFRALFSWFSGGFPQDQPGEWFVGLSTVIWLLSLWPSQQKHTKIIENTLCFFIKWCQGISSTCAICLSDFNAADTAIVLAPCGETHLFHRPGAAWHARNYLLCPR